MIFAASWTRSIDHGFWAIKQWTPKANWCPLTDGANCWVMHFQQIYDWRIDFKNFQSTYSEACIWLKTQLEAADSNPLNQIKVQSDRYPAKLCVLGLSGEILVGKHWSEHIFIRFQICTKSHEFRRKENQIEHPYARRKLWNCWISYILHPIMKVRFSYAKRLP